MTVIVASVSRHAYAMLTLGMATHMSGPEGTVIQDQKEHEINITRIMNETIKKRFCTSQEPIDGEGRRSMLDSHYKT
jgi:hypothetical protein